MHQGSLIHEITVSLQQFDDNCECDKIDLDEDKNYGEEVDSNDDKYEPTQTHTRSHSE